MIKLRLHHPSMNRHLIRIKIGDNSDLCFLFFPVIAKKVMQWVQFVSRIAQNIKSD